MPDFRRVPSSILEGDTPAARRLWRHTGAVGATGTLAAGDLAPTDGDDDTGWPISGERTILLRLDQDVNGGAALNTTIRPWWYSDVDQRWSPGTDEITLDATDEDLLLEIANVYDRCYFQVVAKGDPLHIIDAWGVQVSY